jgi:dihydropteroate synthase
LNSPSHNPFLERLWALAHGRELVLGPTGYLMGILNVTPDSFSDGGLLSTEESVANTARKMVEDGAAILDIGGESTRPGADPVDAATEQKRVLPSIAAAHGAPVPK